VVPTQSKLNSIYKQVNSFVFMPAEVYLSHSSTDLMHITVNLLNVLLSAWAAFDRTQRHLKHSSFATAKLDTINNFRVFPLTEGKELRLTETNNWDSTRIIRQSVYPSVA